MAKRWSSWQRSLAVPLVGLWCLGCAQPGAGPAATAGGAVPDRTVVASAGGIAPGDLVGLERVAVPPANVAYSRPGVDFGRFTAFLIEPVLFTDPGAPARLGIDSETVSQMRDSARRNVTRVLRRYYDLVEAAGPAVLTVELLLVGLTSIPAQEAPAWDDAMTSAFYFGRAEFQAVLRNPETGEILAVILDPRTPRRATPDWAYEVHRWGHLGFVFREWAKQFRGRYDMMRHRHQVSGLPRPAV